MALKDTITLGMSLPHRSPEPIDMSVVHRVAQRADALGFRDLWVTENTLDHVFSFDPMVILTYAAAVTRPIRGRGPRVDPRRRFCGLSAGPKPDSRRAPRAHARLREQRPRDPRRRARA